MVEQTVDHIWIIWEHIWYKLLQFPLKQNVHQFKEITWQNWVQWSFLCPYEVKETVQQNKFILLLNLSSQCLCFCGCWINIWLFCLLIIILLELIKRFVVLSSEVCKNINNLIRIRRSLLLFLGNFGWHILRSTSLSGFLFLLLSFLLICLLFLFIGFLIILLNCLEV